MRILLLLFLVHSIFAQDPKRCGKVYRADATVTPPGGQFPLPVTAPTAQLALRCNPALVPFLPDDLGNNSSSLIIVDALVRDKEIAGSQPLEIPSSVIDINLVVNVSIDGVPLTSGMVPLYESVAIPFSLSAITPRLEPYSLTCTTTLEDPEQNFTSTPTNLTYLPSPPGDVGSITKLDLRTGGLLAKQADTEDPYKPIFPVGFFSQFRNNLEGNENTLEALKNQGFNVVHPFPPFDDWEAFNIMADKIKELGLWLTYDMRLDYKDSDEVTDEVIAVMSLPNLLMYYTAYEPDASEDPPAAPASAAALINSLDPYRPSALTLNCQDYFFSDYAAGTPILMQDAFPIGINGTYSSQFQTPCTNEQGNCGCDNCSGDFEDIRNRIDDFTMRLEALGWERSTTVWTVLQAFPLSTTTNWLRTPTGAEILVQIIVGVNAGARGVMAWNDPGSTSDMKAAVSTFAEALPDLTPFLLSSPLSQPPIQYDHVITSDRLDIGVWSSDNQTLVIAANLNDFDLTFTLDKLSSATKFKNLDLVISRMVLDGGASIVDTEITFGAVESGAWIFG